MKPVSVVSGTMVPLPLADVDTDQIIPKQFLTRTERTGYGDFLFFDWATTADGSPSSDFFTNDPARAGSRVLVTGRNFGCGSSREHAVWAIQDWGFDAVIAPSFGDIFRNNAVNVGLLTVELPEEIVARLLELAQDPAAVVTIDLREQTVEFGDVVAEFEIDRAAKEQLMAGLDPIGLTLQRDVAISAHEARRPDWMSPAAQ
ncbi:MAG TPA: 3-isopropylmalate dehydratase small subunit [Acidimicrobiia bacterium]|nr:3-isopropylmalate dehydratase small subunit [Acidimicrobiia bacterium]